MMMMNSALLEFFDFDYSILFVSRVPDFGLRNGLKSNPSLISHQDCLTVQVLDFAQSTNFYEERLHLAPVNSLLILMLYTAVNSSRPC